MAIHIAWKYRNIWDPSQNPGAHAGRRAPGISEKLFAAAAATVERPKRPRIRGSLRGLLAFGGRRPKPRRPQRSVSEPAARYRLVRRERVIVGPATAAPYPIHHETVIASSDSLAELSELRERIRVEPCGSTAMSVQPDGWVDRVPGEKAFSYEIREK